jgi:hypothetical protein
MTVPTDLEHKILLSLEEAGEDHLSALLNTVVQGHGDPGEISSFRDALTNLINEDCLRLARSRRPAQGTLKPLSQPESLAVLVHLNALLQWSDGENIWKWNEDAMTRMDVVLTDEGMVTARQRAREGQ